MPSILPLVEGHGEVKAVPTLLKLLLTEQGNHTWYVDHRRLKRVRGLSYLRKSLTNFLGYLRIDDPDAVLILLDLDDGCPVEEARSLSAEIVKAQLPFPVAVVFALREYEAWFLSSLPTVAGSTQLLPTDLEYDGDPEARRGCKGWLSRQMPSGMIYKETQHQEEFTRFIDPECARANSRSFRRLCSAVEQLVQNVGVGSVTP